MRHQFELTVETDVILSQDRVYDLVHQTLQVGQGDAADTAEDDDMSDDARQDAQIVADMEFTLRAVPPPTTTTQLTRVACRFVQDLDDMGFGTDDPINGGDCVEFIDQSQQLLRRLPALAELAEAVDRFLAASVPQDGSYSQIIEPLIAAHVKLKEPDMPYKSEWVPPELFLTHAGVNIFYTYKDDDWDQGARTYWFTTTIYSSEDYAFDVRELDSALLLEQHPPYLGTAKSPEDRAQLLKEWDHWHKVEEPDHIRAIIAASIDAGMIKMPDDPADNEHAEEEE